MSRLQTLRDELDAGHPDTGAYSLDDAIASDEVNVVNRERNISELTSSEILNAVNVPEFVALSAVDQAEFWNLLSIGTLNPFGVESTIMVNIFGGGSVTILALAALRKETISRAVELGLINVRPGTVTQARAL